MKKIVSIFTLIILLSTSILFVPNASAANNQAYLNAVNLGEKLKATASQYNQRINEGEIVTLDLYYDQLSSLIRTTEKAIGKVPGSSNRKNLNTKYVTPAKVSRERVIYEVSQFRLLTILEGHLQSGNLSKLKNDLGKLDRLKRRATEIKQAGGYAGLPSSVNKSLSQWESDIRNHKNPIENQVIKAEVEANNTLNSANSIESGVIYKGKISDSTDVDYYKLNANDAGHIRVSLTDLPKDYEVAVYDRADNLVARSSRGGTNGEYITIERAVAGNYFIKVYPNGNDDYSEYEYKLKVTYEANNKNGSNDTMTSASLIENGRYYLDTLEDPQDIDWYTFTSDKRGDVHVTLDTLRYDYEVYLVNKFGEIVSRSTKGNNLSESIYVSDLEAGTYYIYVLGDSDDDYSKDDKYRLRADYPKNNIYFASLAEANNVMDNAFPLINSVSYEFKIEHGLDIDWYKITPNPGTLRVVLDQLPEDYELYLYDQYGTSVESSTRGARNNEVIEYDVREKVTYYIRVVPDSSSDYNKAAYRLRAFY
ncbi:pre-peptidase C-terminal domain-containing protein [Metabacillus sp. B2-18]|uniref:pre-peptidase C-terminal domain-containing protein n=1 Tax=Metabacillus sp. B2-18 TaxID=2897333 RepID=UPI001E457552|nr:pre-peptidase C-terminal domain-containing protein [Metabacillus sp. B2-18]UGB30558.1 hypothetical protein LPC09_23150 [Metabacillus sp. B2-18]